MPLPVDDVERMRPRPGQVFVERDEQPERYGTFVIMPESYRTKVKSSIATVIAVGLGVALLRPEDRVLVSAGVGRRMAFGDHDERLLYVCEPEQLIALVFEDGDEARVEELGEASEGRFRFVSQRALHALEGKADEGEEKRAGSK